MNWKDHPFVVAVASSVATITVVATLVFTAIIPTWLRSKDNDIAAQEARIRDLQAQMRDLQNEPARLKGELEGLTGQVRRLETENLKLRRDLDKLSPDSLFSVDDVYPRGFRAVRIGDRIDVVSRVYGLDAEIKDEEGWISVRFKKAQLFTGMAYYYNERASVKTVTHILFHFQNEGGRMFNDLKQQLIDKYSQTAMTEITRRGKKQLVWSGIQNHTLELGDGTFSISSK